MDWLSGMNKAIGYIESNLIGNIELDTAARCVCCSTWEFQRIFSFMAGVSLSEYIRRRRLTLATKDIKNSDIKIIDIALKYGYDSPAAFSRAFNRMHGVSPTSVRSQAVCLKAYLPLSFNFTLQGATEMEYNIEKKESFKVIGDKRLMNTNDNAHFRAIGEFWDEFENGELGTKLKNHSSCDEMYAISTYGDVENEFYYMIAVPYDGKAVEGLEVTTIPAGEYAIFNASIEDEKNIGEFTKRIFREWLPASGYKLTGGAEIEMIKDGRTKILLPIKK